MAYRLLLSLLLACGAGYLVVARTIALDPVSAAELVNSRTLPTVYGALLVAALLVLLMSSPQPARPLVHARQAVGVLVVLLVFLWLVPLAGIWLAVVVLLLSTQLLLGERSPRVLAATSLGVPGLGWLLVEKLLGIHVPAGAW